MILAGCFWVFLPSLKLIVVEDYERIFHTYKNHTLTSLTIIYIYIIFHNIVFMCIIALQVDILLTSVVFRE